MFLRGDNVLISSRIAESLNVSRIVTIVVVDYDDRYPYYVEFSNGARHWVPREELQPIKKNCAKVV